MNITKTITHLYEGGQTVIELRGESERFRKEEFSNDSETRSDNTFSRGSNKAVLVRSFYRATDDDFYIGVDASESTTIFLPENPIEGKIIIVKAEMKPPIANRQIVVKCSNDDLIDGYNDYVIQVSHDSLMLLYRAKAWHIIK